MVISSKCLESPAYLFTSYFLVSPLEENADEARTTHTTSGGCLAVNSEPPAAWQWNSEEVRTRKGFMLNLLPVDKIL